MSLLVHLPEPRLSGTMSLEEAIAKRRSRRNLLDKPLTLEQLSQILWSAYGVTYKEPMLHTPASAGACYPYELFIMTGDKTVADLKAGLYCYHSGSHKLELLRECDLRKSDCWWQDMLKIAPVTIIFGVDYKRTTKRFGERGRERYVPMDLGHSGENIYLQCEALGLGTVAVGAFDDDKVCETLQLPKPFKPLYMFPIGHYK